MRLPRLLVGRRRGTFASLLANGIGQGVLAVVTAPRKRLLSTLAPLQGKPGLSLGLGIVAAFMGYLAALVLGRFPRYFLLTLAGAVLKPPTWAVLGTFGARLLISVMRTPDGSTTVIEESRCTVTAPRPGSILDSTTWPMARFSGLAFNSSNSASSNTFSSSSSIPCPVLAEISWH